MRTKSPLMMDGLYHLDTNPDVVRILPYPIRIEYPSNQDQGVFRMRDHTFQMGVELRTGERVYIDYEPFNIQLERPWIADRTANLVQVTRNELGANYALLDERTIYIQPRFSNLKVMWAHLHVSDDEALMAVRRVIQIVNLPTTISAVRRQIKVSGIKFEVLDPLGHVVSQRALDEVDRVFTAIMQMISKGEIDIDYSKPFDDSSLLFERR
ncbi:hypothetical protein GOD57_30100 [Sinorhizobium medicae]|nr:hypothetical protein [Sinorhizobium medicae]